MNQAVDAHQSTEFLCFRLGSEQYGLDILNVREIKTYEGVTPLAKVPKFIKGVINLRGEIVPVVDLRLKFEVGEATYNEYTIVIILQIEGRLVGIVVDEVSDVIHFNMSQVKPAPTFSTALDVSYLYGLGASDEHGMVILINITRLVTSEELALFDQQVANKQE